MTIKHRLPGLDTLRSIAIISVILYHYPKNEDQLYLRAITHYGWIGVDLFFVLSGFLIGGQAFREIIAHGKLDTIRFYQRRFLRTLPSYYIILLITLIFFWTQGRSISEGWKYFFFLQNFELPKFFTHSWSLCVEEHFYLVFPWIVSTLHRLKTLKISLKVSLMVGFLFLAEWIQRAIFFKHYRFDLAEVDHIHLAWSEYLRHIFYPTWTHIDGLLIGVGISAIQVYRPKIWTQLLNQGRMFLVGSLILLLLSSWIAYSPMNALATIFGFTFISLSFGMLIITAVSEKTWLGTTYFPLTKKISELSYSMYLTHVFGIHAAYTIVQFFNASITSILLPSLSALGIGLFSFLLHITVEKPFLRLRDRLKLKI